MPATPTTNPTKAAIEAAVADLTDAQIVRGLLKVDGATKQSFEAREAYAWTREAELNVLAALARRLETGRVPARG